MAVTAITERVEQFAERLVFTDPSDLPAMAQLHTEFQALAQWASESDQPLIEEAMRAAADLVEQVILQEGLEPAVAMKVLGRTVSALQDCVRDGRSSFDVSWPAELSLSQGGIRLASEPSGQQEPAYSESEPESDEGKPLEGDLALIGEFVAEAREHLEASDVHLLTLETAPDNTDAINAVFRAFHTIKGVAGFMALGEIQALAHEAESLLDHVRKGELPLTGAAMDICFDAVDMLKRMIDNVSQALQNNGLLAPEKGLKALVAKIRDVAAGNVAAPPVDTEIAASVEGMRLGEILVNSGTATDEAVRRAMLHQKIGPPQKLGEILVDAGKTSSTHVSVAAEIRQNSPELGKIGEILVEMNAIAPDELDAALEYQKEHPAQRLGEILVKSGDANARDVGQALRNQRTQAQGAGTTVHEPVKVDADRLDRLIDTIGELVIAESMVIQSQELRSFMESRVGGKGELARQLGQLDKITRELQEMGTSLRMVPIRATFQKMARLVRDLAKKSGKTVEFVTLGEETELDKTVVDKIGDPLVHMVRNSVDHGLEPTVEARRQAGKPDAGTVTLRAFHKGGGIHVEIEDDGRGLNREAILAKARERGLVREGETLADRDVWSLIFEPGFSTAEKVTDVSGRGVGMDVVKRNIEALRGQVDIQTAAGKGTVFSIRLPLTLAIIDGMVVRVAHERYIIPTLSIVMSIRPEAKQLSSVAGRGEMLSLQGRLLPMFRLAQLFGTPDATKDATQGIVVVVEDEGRQTGVLVDDILGEQQIVIKSLGEMFQNTPGIAGGAIMPDGNVGLIVDVGGLVKSVH